ncbi:TetR/AcrR family transcriptional regulator [Paenarthrobacter sp. RAF54_2]|uniref:TetR/AcrR family transcriptional regulator n=1 Tax=Paenarthrobacter sp. RAF54_2 TaxID=3233061 RepID=UPI003F9532BD
MTKESKLPNVGRERILEAAASRFLRNGYAGTTLGSIAADLGITTPALYWHFRSKEDLFASALEQVLVSFVTFVRDSVTASDPATRLAQTVAAHVTWQLEQSDVASAYASTVGMKPLLAGLSEKHQAKLVGIQRDYMRELRTTLASGRVSGRFEFSDEGVAAYAIVTMCEYVHAWFNPGGRMTVSQVTRHMVDLALRLVGADGTVALDVLPGTDPTPVAAVW